MFARLVVLMSLALPCLGASFVFAGEIVAIGEILKSPENYAFHNVTLKGTARQVKTLGKVQGKMCVYENPYTFLLDDGTGVMEVEVAGTCIGRGKATVVEEGQHVIVDAHISRFTSGASTHTVKGYAAEVRVVK